MGWCGYNTAHFSARLNKNKREELFLKLSSILDDNPEKFCFSPSATET